MNSIPVLLLHGALGSSVQLHPLQRALELTGRKVFVMNFSGHSGAPFSLNGFGIEVFADDVLQFLEKHDLHRVDVVGYSMGGYVALWFAFQFPKFVGRIITLGTKFDWTPESARQEVARLDSEKILLKVPAFARLLEHRHAPNSWKELLSLTGEMMLHLGTSPLLTEEILKKIQHPVLVCLGDLDDMADRTYSEAVANLLPHGQFLLLNATPHPLEKVDLQGWVDIVHRYFSGE